jgi:hypothetical protein
VGVACVSFAFWQTELTDTRNFGLRQFGSEEGTSHPSRIRGVWV